MIGSTEGRRLLVCWIDFECIRSYISHRLFYDFAGIGPGLIPFLITGGFLRPSQTAATFPVYPTTKLISLSGTTMTFLIVLPVVHSAKAGSSFAATTTTS